MDFTTKQWLVGIIVIVILAILIDGFRRMKRARQDSLHMSLDPKTTATSSEKGDRLGSEFPNGGARPSQKSIDKERIKEVKSQFDFGRDISEILKRDKYKESDEPIEGEDQWVDEEEGDEEYYARKWDDEYEEDSETDSELEGHATSNELATDDTEEPYVEEPRLTNEKPLADEKPLASKRLSANKKQASAIETNNDVIETIEDSQQQEAAAYAEPKQVPLNLEESVPVLMETIDDASESDSVQETEEAIVDAAEPEISEDSSYEDLGDEDITIRPVGKHIKPAVEPVIAEEESLDTRSANKPRYRSKYFSSEVQEEATTSSLSEVLVINVKASPSKMMQGSDLLELVLENGLRYGEMNIFHYHADEDGEGPVLFSMASMLKPGTFDLKTMDSFSTIGVTFFLTLPVFDNQNMAAYELMLTTAKNIASALGAELNDDQRSIMTAQTMEHYRERIRDFARRQQLEKNK